MCSTSCRRLAIWRKMLRRRTESRWIKLCKFILFPLRYDRLQRERSLVEGQFKHQQNSLCFFKTHKLRPRSPFHCKRLNLYFFFCPSFFYFFVLQANSDLYDSRYWRSALCPARDTGKTSHRFHQMQNERLIILQGAGQRSHCIHWKSWRTSHR